MRSVRRGRSGFESDATVWMRTRDRAASELLLPDQAVRSPTKPAVVGTIPTVMSINTLGLLSSLWRSMNLLVRRSPAQA